MAKRSSYHYANSSYCKVGRMVCGSCKGPIEGEYRYHMPGSGDNEHYVTHHRFCCSKDPEWKRLDDTEMLFKQGLMNTLDDYTIFYEKHAEGMDSDLNEVFSALIHDLKKAIGA